MGGFNDALDRWLPRLLWAAVGFAVLAGGCHRGSGGTATPPGVDASAEVAAAPSPAAPGGENAAAQAAPSDKPLLGIVAFVATIYKEPRDTAKKLGYLRVGAKVPRSAEPVSKAGCPGGWYEIKPRGFVCAGDEATTNMEDPILKAAEKRPNLKTALPYRYAFVRAVLPLYMRVPSAEEQLKAEFKLKEHLEWFNANKDQVSKVILGASDVPIDDRGVPIAGKMLGEMGLGKNSQEIGIGALLGGESDNDPIPFWLEGGKRLIVNVSEYKTKGFELFADRARRHTGLALVGSFPTGEESLHRRFAVTTDYRLAPASKIKPDTGSAFHGVELDDKLTLPVAFIRSQGARAYKVVHGKVVPLDDLEHRRVIGLTGTMRTLEGVKYYRTTDKRWVGQQDVGLAVQPSTWPEDAEKGKKWIEISITNQTLVLWEGKRPVYATLISSGQDGLDDPKKTTATVRGTFHIRNKHISAMMDSNESSSVGGRANTTAVATAIEGPAEADDEDRKPDKPAAAAVKPKPKSAAKDAKDAKDAKTAVNADRKTPPKGDKALKNPKVAAKDPKSTGKDPNGAKAKASADAKAKSSPIEKEAPRKGDGAYGVTRRRGEGTFQLRDVPFIQYFESGYALHAAYWHDVFGTPRSHGCVNLSPVDAHRIFLWTDPPLPEGWHAVNASDDMGEGTTVIIHE
jgi:lipoprotein-anchoring transpeptidase ErfK/SrfK